MLKLFNRKKKDNKGFTLVELVIVVAILAILVGILAPQYTKYVEKSRKAADASNMDEMVKVIKVFAADPVNDLPADEYVITIGDTATTLSDNATTELTTAMGEAIPKWDSTSTKSKKWSPDGGKADIIATVTVKPDGGTSVAYTTSKDDTADTNKFAKYMANGSEE